MDELYDATVFNGVDALADTAISVDQSFIDARCETDSFEHWASFISRPEHSPEATADHTGVPADLLRQAARLLLFTALGIEEVARQVGFQSAFYFSRQFKQHYGLSPSAYRLAQRGQGP